MQPVGGILKSEDTPSDWFVERQDINPQNGQIYPSFDMTKDGFTLLVMGYTGAKAMEFENRPKSGLVPTGTMFANSYDVATQDLEAMSLRHQVADLLPDGSSRRRRSPRAARLPPAGRWISCRSAAPGARSGGRRWSRVGRLCPPRSPHAPRAMIHTLPAPPLGIGDVARRACTNP